MENSGIASKITFKEVRALAANEGWSKRLLDRLDRFLGAAILLTPAVLGPTGIIALSFLEPKDELIKIGRSLIERFSSSRTEDFVARRRRMTAAYCLMTYTAFFDAIEVKLPNFAREVALTDEERSLIAQSPRQQDFPTTQPQDAATLIEFPHPAMAPAAERAARIDLYQRLTQAYLRFVQGLAVWESDSGQRSQLKTAIQALPETAAEIFEAQYLELVIKYPEFYRWAELYELTKSRQLSSDLIGDLDEKIHLFAQAAQGIDVGLRHLNELVTAAAGLRTGGGSSADRVTRGLHNVYVNNIEQPVIDDKPPDPAVASLTYPRKCDIFVPQSFQVIRYLDPTLRLELESAWANAATGQDLGTFTLRYLESAYSTETPLLVLGHPGSGKSLYTEMIAARFAPPRYHPIRIELRDINADDELQEQIERQIYKDTGYDVSWALVADEWCDYPPVIILDGYDELLQASGKVFSNYLRRVQTFQRREAVQGRPVRVIVTSRITLIDKTLMPLGVTVVKLQDFDTILRDRWIDVWNETNSAYFARTGVRPFGVPQDWESSHLAAQPLLLLMLAIYDSEANELRHSDLDRTLLYHSLLVRFIERERTKGDSANEFRALTSVEQKAQIESDLERLGVTALGMFNRRSLYIEGDALNKDIAYFGLGRERDVQSGKKLTQAELLVGSFFFIHESKSGSGTTGDVITPTAFEFLHNTFGEFLTADFILRKVLDATHSIRSLGEDRRLSDLRERQLIQPPNDWLACLVFTSLHTRPVVCSMMREWLAHRLRMEDRQAGNFEEDLTVVTLRQLDEVLVGNAASTVSGHVALSPYGSFSTLGHLAVYSLNLVLLVLTLTGGDVTFNEASLATPLAGCPPWHRLIGLWRSWFSLESLAGLRSAMQARRRGEEIVLSLPSGELAKGTSVLENTYNVADSLADDVVYGLAASHVFDVGGVNWDHLSTAAQRLSAHGIDLFPLFDVRTAGDGIPWIRSVADHMSHSGHFSEAEKLFRRALDILVLSSDWIGVADTYVKLARLMYSSGRASAAEDCYQKAIEILNPLGSLRRIAEICREMAELKSTAAVFDEAEGWSQRAAEIFERMGDEPSVADTYRQLGSFMLDGGRPDSARFHLTSALDIFERLGYQTGIAETYRQMGRLGFLTGRPDEAERSYERALEIFERLNDQLDIARTCVQIGQFRWHLKRFDQAESSYRRAAGIFGRCGAWPQLGDAHYWLGMIAKQNGHPEEAESGYLRALDILQSRGDPLLAAPAHHQLGMLYQEQGQVEAAERNYREALDVFLGKSDQRAFQTASMLAKLLADENRHVEACEVLLSSAKEAYEITGNWDLADVKLLSRERQILGQDSFWQLITDRFPQELQNELVTVIKKSGKHLPCTFKSSVAHVHGSHCAAEPVT